MAGGWKQSRCEARRGGARASRPAVEPCEDGHVILESAMEPCEAGAEGLKVGDRSPMRITMEGCGVHDGRCGASGSRAQGRKGSRAMEVGLGGDGKGLRGDATEVEPSKATRWRLGLGGAGEGSGAT
ncbi:hypothetical protein GUJ93_ZPchr0005g14616 [Zizania palustris]|uniref:Uncharacterized protein n=1 Tax=Zizania palustris TaxID=103762 RepID=A0A8J5SHC9_ZIZPA|nr:hypothetical protein GUJ93_ZPchr0005g14616 [Zizania palustris]